MGVDKILFDMERRALREEERRKGSIYKASSKIEDIGTIFLIFLYISAVAGILYLLVPFILKAFLKTYDYVASIISPIPAAIAFGTLALPLGWIFFKVREEKRILYSYLEICFGVFSAIFTVGDKNPGASIGNISLITYIALFASIYIIVRGFDNLQQGKKQIAERNRLLISAEQNQIETVKYLVESGVDINCKSSEDLTPLMLAVRAGNIEIVKFLLNRGADKKIKSGHTLTALELAKLNKHVEIVKLLNDED